ncbi:30S ribosomal protein S8 [Candidatus Roizmanbacteria bacterium]|nr:30S ribosomal protein S8 [Candidatus Roizmanbacteria bacterium]
MGNACIDLLIRIKNGYLARKERVKSPHSRFKEEVVKKLIQLGYAKSHKISQEGGKKNLEIELLYLDGKPSFTDVKFFSKPGRRWYVSYKEIPQKVRGGFGSLVLSTPYGVLTNIEAKKGKAGGELLFEIW